MAKKTIYNQEKQKSTQVKKIFRSEKNRILGGVAGGIGEYFSVDPVLVRILFVLLGLSGGGVILYLILWLIIPDQLSNHSNNEENLKKNAQEIKAQAQKYVQNTQKISRKKETRLWFGLALIFLGAYFVLLNFGILSRLFEFSRLWPLALVALGLALLFRP
ncbi:MAG: PspC domain-containing protein [Candidatus Shapirobacteria bacterium]|nr:PspC domain-containing protein [Candidatus Shapirobacteria bacterium]MDD5073602.1 PspC domain-containing protein [Candidatus Shapirobacteria bacterium]MDD5481355.1 PspC domain-containing protein [Candidatus Shapirobacteria bacterium]